MYTFKLQENVKFHNGNDFDASDVQFSINRARDENSTNAQKGLFKGISSVDVVNSGVVKITLSNPNGGFIRNLAWGDAIILDPDTADSAATEPNGTGPFKFSKWIKGDRVELVKNNNYWGEPIALEKASFKFISDPTAAFAALMAGDVDAFQYILLLKLWHNLKQILILMLLLVLQREKQFSQQIINQKSLKTLE